MLTCLSARVALAVQALVVAQPFPARRGFLRQHHSQRQQCRRKYHHPFRMRALLVRLRWRLGNLRAGGKEVHSPQGQCRSKFTRNPLQAATPTPSTVAGVNRSDSLAQRTAARSRRL